MGKKIIIPQNYTSALSLRETQRAIKLIKDTFQVKLSEALCLDRVTAPLIVMKSSGINDDLTGAERKVAFTMKEVDGTAEIVQSLAKWKRMALYRYGYRVGEGIYTDMNAVRRDDDCDNLHSIFVDQWDWEKVISHENRNIYFLKETVSEIVNVLYETNEVLRSRCGCLSCEINKDVFFVTSQELENMYPSKTPKEREAVITRKHGTVFIIGIGQPLKSGKRHDARAPDYDDWSLNGDLLVWHKTLSCALELSSMGIRVDAPALEYQLKASGTTDRAGFPYHHAVLSGKLPLTVGGGLGQSRICMLLLGKAHIGEVQVSVWPSDMAEECSKHGIMLL